ncbi:MAG: aminopeptidase C, partial [Fimbriimonadaceae bacterium]
MAGTVVKGPDTTGAMSPQVLDQFHKNFLEDRAARMAMNAVTKTPVNKVATNRDVASAIDHSYSIHLDENKITHQKQSGRCWLFAALNTFRTVAMKKMNFDGKDFEFSQNYVMFFDKLEKANYFLENVLKTLDEPTGSRIIDHLLTDPIQDGGQWHMFVNLIKKYGVVPKGRMEETESSGATRAMNTQITGRLREFACRLRQAAEAGTGEAELREQKEEMLAQVYKMLSIHLGTPPASFDWQWRDKDKEFHRREAITPQAFYEEFVGMDLDDYVCLIHDPRPHHEFNQTYTVKFLVN